MGVTEGSVVFHCGTITRAGPHRAVLTVGGRLEAVSPLLQVAWPPISLRVPAAIETYASAVDIVVAFTTTVCTPLIRPSSASSKVFKDYAIKWVSVRVASGVSPWSVNLYYMQLTNQLATWIQYFTLVKIFLERFKTPVRFWKYTLRKILNGCTAYCRNAFQKFVMSYRFCYSCSVLKKDKSCWL